MGHCVKLVEVQLVLGGDVDVRATVLRLVAVLGRREDWARLAMQRTSTKRHRLLTCNALSVVLLLVSVHPDLVASDDGLQAVLLAEALGHVGAELHAHAALAGAAAWRRLGVGPQHLHHQAGLAGLSLRVAVQLTDVVKGDVVVREKTAVEHQVLFAHQRGQGQRREALREEFEHPGWQSATVFRSA